MKNHAHNTHKHKHERDIRTLHIDIWRIIPPA
jgi:hypothetical protein